MKPTREKNKSPKKTVKKVIKKITKESKLKKEILTLTEKLHEADRTVNYWKGRHDSLNEKFDEIEKRNNRFLERFECKEIPFATENRWLRETIELLCIPAEKLEKLEEIRRARDPSHFNPNRY